MWNCPMWFGRGPWYRGYWNVTPWIFNIILLGTVILFILYIISKSITLRPSTRDATIEILRRKYAEGEITKEELRKKLKDLNS